MKIAVYNLLTALFIVSCGITDKPDDDNDVAFAGITERFENGAPGKLTDSTDWLPDGCGRYNDSIDYCMLDGLTAFPNPCTNSVAIQFTIQKDGFVKIALNEKPDTEVKVLVNNELVAGTYEYQLDVYQNGIKPGIYRVYIEFEPDSGKICKSFGDIQVNL